MSKIIYHYEDLKISGDSNSLIYNFETDEFIQGFDTKAYQIITLNGKIISTTETFDIRTVIYPTGHISGDTYPYKYNIIVYVPANTKYDYIFSVDVNCLFKETSENMRIIFSQNKTTSPSYIKDISLFDESGKQMEVDIYGRFIIPVTYAVDSKFTLRYNSAYQSSSSVSVYPSIERYEYINEDFIRNLTSLGPNAASFTITDIANYGASEILKIYFKDPSSTNILSQTYIAITRDEMLPISISFNPDNMNDLAPSAKTNFTTLTCTNISFSNLSISYDFTWAVCNLTTDQRLSVKTALNNTPSRRSGVINISGTNNYGQYIQFDFPVSQIPANFPYFTADDTELDKFNTPVPVINTYFSGQVINEPNIIINNIISESGYRFGVDITIEGESTNFFRIEYIEGTRNAKVVIDTKYKPNFKQEINKLIANFEFMLEDGSSINESVYIIQQASPEIIISPLWKDIFYETNKRYFRFKIIDTDDIIYNGKVYLSANKNIKVNEIIQNYIDINKNIFNNNDENYYVLNNSTIKIVLEISDNPDFVEYDAAKLYYFYWDYSYSYNDINNYNSNPIEYYDQRQIMLINIKQDFNQYNDYIEVYGKKSGEDTVLLDISENTFIDDSITICIRPGNYDEIILNNGDDPISCGKLKCNKSKYAIYYLNSYGKWCWMLANGRQLETNNIIRNRYIYDNDNSVSYNIHSGVYNTTINEVYDLTTDYLTDLQSKLLKDLYISPLIYVHELDNDVIYNVFCTTNSYDIKTFKNQGKKLFTHNIKLQKSMSKKIIL